MPRAVSAFCQSTSVATSSGRSELIAMARIIFTYPLRISIQQATLKSAYGSIVQSQLEVTHEPWVFPFTGSTPSTSIADGMALMKGTIWRTRLEFSAPMNLPYLLSGTIVV